MLRRWLPAEVKGRHGWSVLWSTNIAVFAVGSVLVFTLGSWLFNAGTITIGSVYLIFHYTEMLRHPLDRIRNQMEDFQKAAAGIHRVQALLDRETRLPRNGTETLPSGPLSVDLRRIDFSYREDEDPNGSPEGSGAGGGSAGERVLHDVSLSLAPGRILGLLGILTVDRSLFFVDQAHHPGASFCLGCHNHQTNQHLARQTAKNNTP